MLDNINSSFYIASNSKHGKNIMKSKLKIKPIVNKAEIARRLGLSRQYVGQLLNGRRHNAERIQEIERVIHSELHNFKRGKAA